MSAYNYDPANHAVSDELDVQGVPVDEEPPPAYYDTVNGIQQPETNADDPPPSHYNADSGMEHPVTDAEDHQHSHYETPQAVTDSEDPPLYENITAIQQPLAADDDPSLLHYNDNLEVVNDSDVHSASRYEAVYEIPQPATDSENPPLSGSEAISAIQQTVTDSGVPSPPVTDSGVPSPPVYESIYAIQQPVIGSDNPAPSRSEGIYGISQPVTDSADRPPSYYEAVYQMPTRAASYDDLPPAYEHPPSYDEAILGIRNIMSVSLDTDSLYGRQPSHREVVYDIPELPPVSVRTDLASANPEPPVAEDALLPTHYKTFLKKLAHDTVIMFMSLSNILMLAGVSDIFQKDTNAPLFTIALNCWAVIMMYTSSRMPQNATSKVIKFIVRGCELLLLILSFFSIFASFVVFKEFVTKSEPNNWFYVAVFCQGIAFSIQSVIMFQFLFALKCTGFSNPDLQGLNRFGALRFWLMK